VLSAQIWVSIVRRREELPRQERTRSTHLCFGNQAFGRLRDHLDAEGLTPAEQTGNLIYGAAGRRRGQFAALQG
jgi:hypothetical protein